ncbi:MAG: ribulose-phosphate 3-epimerase [Ignavibacteria bacterium]
MKFLSPSILSSDFSDLKSTIRILELGNADWIHLDIMDGNFVPNLTFGPIIVEAINRITNLPLDTHLMIFNPDNYIEKFVEAGSDILTVHQEALTHLHRTIMKIKSYGIKAGVSINPATSIYSIENVLEEVDLVLIMSVNPGFGGQSFIKNSLKKISALRELKEKNNYNFLIEVDGGIDVENVQQVIEAGADVVVVGAAIFKDLDPVQKTLKLKSLISKY